MAITFRLCNSEIFCFIQGHNTSLNPSTKQQVIMGNRVKNHNEGLFSKVALVLVPLSILVIIVPAWLYCGKFVDGNGFSNSQEIWGQFGDFMNMWVSLASLLLLAGLTLIIHDRETSLQKTVQKQTIALDRPVIIFKLITYPEADDDDQGLFTPPTEKERLSPKWVLKNIGNGPAFNIKFHYKREHQSDFLSKVAKLYSLAAGEQLELPGKTMSRMIATYQDISKNYTTSQYHEYDTYLEFGSNHFYDVKDDDCIPMYALVKQLNETEI